MPNRRLNQHERDRGCLLSAYLLTCSLGFLLLLAPCVVQGEYFGKNKVQYENFRWQYIQSEHFDVYFTEGGEEIAEFVAETAEQALEKLQRSFD